MLPPLTNLGEISKKGVGGFLCVALEQHTEKQRQKVETALLNAALSGSVELDLFAEVDIVLDDESVLEDEGAKLGSLSLPACLNLLSHLNGSQKVVQATGSSKLKHDLLAERTDLEVLVSSFVRCWKSTIFCRFAGHSC